MPLTYLMLLVVSIDRTIAVFHPIAYWKLNKKYAYKMLSATVGIVGLHVLVQYATVNMYCNSLQTSFCYCLISTGTDFTTGL